MKPELRPSLDEILNHPFLRNGGPPQRFSTAHGLRGSSSASSSTCAAGTGGGACAAAAAAAAKKNTPERCAAGGFGRPPLKTRSSNVDAAETEAVQQESARIGGKPRVGVVGSTGKLAFA